MFINLGDKYAGNKSLMGLPWRYALGCIDGKAGDPLILRAEIIWHKLNGLPESVTDRVRRNHEQWFHFTREGSYFSGVDEIRESTTSADGLSWEQRKALGFKGATRGINIQKQPATDGNFAPNPLGKLPGSVWSMALEPLRVPDWLGVDHFAAFPTEWPRKLITGWSPEGGVVLDPFGGTGTVAMVARALGRQALHVDLSIDYLKLAKWRVFESGQWAKAVKRSNEDNQQTLDL
jgi:site-specific DNA-methyltransferase (cytosine-N4-specific)